LAGHGLSALNQLQPELKGDENLVSSPFVFAQMRSFFGSAFFLSTLFLISSQICHYIPVLTGF